MSYIYLASPYSHPDPAIREQRYQAVTKKAAEYLCAGKAVFAPITHSHPMVPYMDEKLCMDFDFWMRADIPLLKGAKELHVLMLDGWQRSRGVTKEIEIADACRIPVFRVQA